MRTFLSLPLVACLSMLLFSSCQNQEANIHASKTEAWLTPSGKLKVLSTISMIGDIVARIGGEHVDNITLINYELDPHSYQLVKGDDEKFSNANIIFYNGLGLEHGPSLQQYLTSSNKALALGNRIMEQMPHLLILDQGNPDPHIWLDISLWSRIVPEIVHELCRRDPEHAQDYIRNGSTLKAQMESAHEEVRKKLLEIPDTQRFLVSSHDAFRYFARAYLATEDERNNMAFKERFAAPEGISPESQLSPIDIQKILDYLDQHQIQVVFTESNVNTDAIKKIVQSAHQKGVSVTIADAPLYADAIGRPGSKADSYLNMMKYNAEAITKNLKTNSKACFAPEECR